MEKRYTIFDLLGQTIFIFGITVICLSIFVVLFGAQAGDVSTIFLLEDKGLSVATLGQFLLMSALITVLRFVFFTDYIIKGWPLFLRTICMFVLVVIMIAVFAAVCGWFPVKEAKSWIMFFVSFFICCSVSVTLSVWKERKENEQLQEALERMKKGDA